MTARASATPGTTPEIVEPAPRRRPRSDRRALSTSRLRTRPRFRPTTSRKMARRHVTVALSGDGGDEAFGGYGWRYVPHALETRRGARRCRAPGRRSAAWLWRRVAALAAIAASAPAGNVPRESRARSAPAAYYADLCFLKPDATRALLGKRAGTGSVDSPVFERSPSRIAECPSDSAVQRAQYADLKIYLPNDVLVKVDRMSMAHGLEMRCPLLDHRVVEFGVSHPDARRRCRRLSRRRCCASLARRRLPDDMAQRRKAASRRRSAPGWPARTRSRFRDDVLGPDSKSRRHRRYATGRAAVLRASSGQHDHSYALWAVWMLERWARQRQTSGDRQHDHVEGVA